jgi:hypothetical protein
MLLYSTAFRLAGMFMSVNLVSKNRVLDDYLTRLNEKYVIEKAQLDTIETEWNKRKNILYQSYDSYDKEFRDRDFENWENINLLPARKTVQTTVMMMQIVEKQIHSNITRRRSVS